MCILDENSQIEAAAALNVSVSMIKSRVYRAKQILSARVRLRTGIAPRLKDHQDQNGYGKGQHEFAQLTSMSSQFESTLSSAGLNRDYCDAI